MKTFISKLDSFLVQFQNQKRAFVSEQAGIELGIVLSEKSERFQNHVVQTKQSPLLQI